jgi:hypothetical protein
MGKYGTGGACGIGATTSGLEWAKQFGVLPDRSEIWLAANSGLYRDYAKNKINALVATGRLVYLEILRKNGGGIASSLKRLFDVARDNNASDEFKKYREIEIKFLAKGGNPVELNEAILEGASKTPTGAYFNVLMKRQAAGGKVNISQWIAGAVSLMFGKKYDPTTGKITGNNTGIGTDPVSGVLVVGSAAWWGVLITGTIGTLGSAYIMAKVGNAPGEDGTEDNGGNNGGGGGNDGDDDQGTSSMLLPILLVGGAAAAYFIFKKK